METKQEVRRTYAVYSHDDRYLYQPLEGPDTIRMLRLSPKVPADPVYGELHHVSLADLESLSGKGEEHGFEAISYVWGEAANSYTNVCYGGVIPITSNLQRALIRTRLRDRTRSIWVDGVCINQNDLKVRGHQVKLMDRTYSTATLVLVWLRDDQDYSAHMAVGTLSRMYGCDGVRLLRRISLCADTSHPYKSWQGATGFLVSGLFRNTYCPDPPY